MKRRKATTLIAILAFLGILGVSRGLAVVHETMAAYEGMAPCSQLDGLSGLLQKVGMLPSGNCVTEPGGSGGCQDDRVCDIKKASPTEPVTHGVCRTVEAKPGVQSCNCVAPKP